MSLKMEDLIGLPPSELETDRCRNKTWHPNAEFAATEAYRMLGEYQIEALWIYQCPVCKGWHLTRAENALENKIVR